MVNHRKSWAGNVFVWLDLTLDPFFKVERGYCICSISTLDPFFKVERGYCICSISLNMF